jgi:hypothetical protein
VRANFLTKTEKCKQIFLTAESCEKKDIPSIFKDKLGDMMGGGGGGILKFMALVMPERIL